VDEEGRRRRFETLFDSAYEPLLAYARRRVPAEADDVVADVFLVAWRRLDDVPADELPWLYGVARKVIHGKRRGARRRGALVRSLELLREPGEAHSADVGPIVRALASLREPDREAILLVACEGLGVAEAARAMNCSEVALRVRLHRARRRLRAELDRDDGRGPLRAATLKEGA